MFQSELSIYSYLYILTWMPYFVFIFDRLVAQQSQMITVQDQVAFIHFVAKVPYLNKLWCNMTRESLVLLQQCHIIIIQWCLLVLIMVNYLRYLVWLTNKNIWFLIAVDYSLQTWSNMQTKVWNNITCVTRLRTSYTWWYVMRSTTVTWYLQCALILGLCYVFPE